MLINLSLRNLVLVEELELEFGPGMTALSGETGAGKSILINALQLALGARAQADMVRSGAPRLEVYASFDLTDIPQAREWLEAAELLSDQDCILGRSVTSDGRSKATINGRPVTAASLRELGALLLDIHGQHEHHGLMQRSVHRALLDESAGLARDRAALDLLAQSWKRVREQIVALEGGTGAEAAQAELLRYQVDELDQLALDGQELEALEQEHQSLAGAEESIQRCGQAAALIDADDADSALTLVERAISTLQQIPGQDAALGGVRECLDNARIQLQEGAQELARYRDHLEINPERLQQIESRLEAIQTLARKHHVLPSELARRHADLREELAALEGRDARLATLRKEADETAAAWQRDAARLTAARKEAAQQLNQSVASRLHALGLKDAVFEAQLLPGAEQSPVAGGAEQVEFHVSMNPGQAPGPLAKIASGGELSRTGLAIRVVTAQRSRTPSLVFDEVDSGVGGATAEIVGRQLQELAAHSQVLCITHLPQVASLAHAHLQVSKSVDEGVTRSRIVALKPAERLEEIARMLGGVKVSKQTRKTAKEMLENA